MTKQLLSISLLFISLLSYSQQDSLFFTNGSVLLGKMQGSEESTINFIAPKAVQFSVDNKHIRKVVLASAQELNFTQSKGLFSKKSEEKILRRFPTTGKEFILKNNGDTIACKLVEINENSVRYSVPNTGADIMFNSKRSEVRDIVFSDGQQVAMNYGAILKASAANGEKLRKNVFKLNLVPLIVDGDFPEFIYERFLSPGLSLKITASMLNRKTSFFFQNNGNDLRTESKRGFNLSVGPVFYLNKTASINNFHGAYIQPELMFSSVVYNESLSINHRNKTTEAKSYSVYEFKSIAGALAVNFGYQFNISNTLALDTKIALGFAYVDNDAEDFMDTGRQYDRGSWQIVGEESGLAPMLKASFAIGLIR